MSDSITVTPVVTGHTDSTAPTTVVVEAGSTPAQTPASEPTKEEPVVTAAPEESSGGLGKRFAELAKRQRELFEREKQIKELEGKLSPVQAAIEAAKQNPLKLLEAAGISYEELTDYILSDGETVDNSKSPVEKKLEELELKLSAKEKAEQEAAEKARMEAVEQQISAFKQSIKAASESYELVSTLEQQDLVYDVILSHHAESGEVLPIEEALRLTESYLEEQSKKILSVKKFSTQATSPKSPEQVVANSVPVPRPSSSSFTLSQSVVPAPASSASVSSEKLTREQLMERAIQSLRFK